MTLQHSKGRPYKAYVKKLENGFGIKTVNTQTRVENVIIITTDSKKDYHPNKKMECLQCQILRPLLSKFSEETISATLSMPGVNQPNYAINKVLAHLQPSIGEIKTGIAGFHLFEEDSPNSSPNIQKTSVLFVANTELARKNGVHFDIPSKLMNMFFVDGQNKEGKIKFTADSIVKPLTIVVGDYVVHINICYDLPFKPQIKTVGTQTKKRYILSSSVDDNIPMYKIESFLFSDLQVKPEEKCTQTDSSILAEKTQLPQTNVYEHYQDNGVQTVFFKDQISYTTASAEKKLYSFGDKSDVSADEDNTMIESFKNSLNDLEDSLNSFTSYNSHTHLHQTTDVNHVRDKKVYETTKIENKEVDKNHKEPTITERKKEKNAVTLFDNSSNYNTKITRSDNAFKSMEPNYSSNSILLTSTKSARFEEDRSKTSVKTVNSDNEWLTQVRNNESVSNTSIKDIKERLNKTTLSLQQLYLAIELLEKKSDNRHSSETTFKTSGYIEKGKYKNKTDMLRQPSIVVTSQVTLEESISATSSSSSTYSQETVLISNQSNSTTDNEKSLSDYEETSSTDTLCDRCGSFHINIGFNGDCTIFSESNIKILENNDYRDIMKSGFSTSQEKLSKNSTSIAHFLPDEMESCGSSDDLSSGMQSRLESNVQDSGMSCKVNDYLPTDESSQYKQSNKNLETRLLEADKDDLDDGALSMSIHTHETVHSEESNQMLRERDYRYTLNKDKNGLDIEKLSEKSLTNRKELQLNEVPNFDYSLADFQRTFKDGSQSSQTLREMTDTYNIALSSNKNYISGELIETTAGCGNSSQSLSNFNDTLQENTCNTDTSKSILINKNTEMTGDSKAIESYNAAQNLKVSNAVFLLSQPQNFISTKREKSSNTITFRNENKTEAKENCKVLYLTSVRNTKSWISFKKSLQSCHCSEKLGLQRKTTNSEPATNQLKIKNLSSGDHQRKNVLCKVSSGFERLKTVGLFNNKSNFLANKYSSSSTLHIIPSSQELLKLKNEESSFQDKEFSTNELGKVSSKSPSFEKTYVNSIGNCMSINEENEHFVFNLTNTTFEKKSLGNKGDFVTSDNSRTEKIVKKSKYTKNKKQNSKHKKSKLFCFFI